MAAGAAGSGGSHSVITPPPSGSGSGGAAAPPAPPSTVTGAGGATAGAGGVGTSGVGAGGTGVGAAGMAGAAGAPDTTMGMGCGQTVPAVTDYSQDGPFGSVTVNGSGPSGAFTLIKPQKLGEGGFLHPIATWGNGITTTPALYPELLGAIASHGFVVIASDSPNVTAAMMTEGLEWLIAQNGAAGDLQGKLDVDCAITIGYSLGGGAAVTSGSHAAVKATVSFHGLAGAAEKLHSPLLLFTSTADGFVTKAGFVQPCYDRSSVVPTVLATLEVPGAPADFAGHLYPLGGAGDVRAPAIAWLRMWVYGDQGGRHYFYGDDCTLCKTPWIDIQRKNAMW